MILNDDLKESRSCKEKAFNDLGHKVSNLLDQF
jgi:hypothetical protein